MRHAAEIHVGSDVKYLPTVAVIAAHGQSGGKVFMSEQNEQREDGRTIICFEEKELNLLDLLEELVDKNPFIKVPCPLRASRSCPTAAANPHHLLVQETTTAALAGYLRFRMFSACSLVII